MDSLQSRLILERETVVSFVTEVPLFWTIYLWCLFLSKTQVLREDQPTGLTPQRTERSFPRYLEATSPHQRILHRFRYISKLSAKCTKAAARPTFFSRSQAEAAVVAARLPLEDSDNEDSVVSSDALSRLIDRKRLIAADMMVN